MCKLALTAHENLGYHPLLAARESEVIHGHNNTPIYVNPFLLFTLGICKATAWPFTTILFESYDFSSDFRVNVRSLVNVSFHSLTYCECFFSFTNASPPGDSPTNFKDFQ